MVDSDGGRSGVPLCLRHPLSQTGEGPLVLFSHRTGAIFNFLFPRFVHTSLDVAVDCKLSAPPSSPFKQMNSENET